MGTTTITIPVDDALAKVYNTTSPENREKIQLVLSLWLREFAASEEVPFGDLMDTISDKAQARGLTPEILESLLNDDQ